MPDDQAFQQCIQAFAEHNYARCARQSNSLLSTGVTHELLQVLLISLQRLGWNDALETLVPRFLTATAGQPWDHLLLRLTTGQVDLVDVLSQAQNEDQRCQAHYYAGARLFSQKQIEAARTEFHTAFRCQSLSLEWMLARMELTFIDSGADVSSAVDPEQEIEQLYKQAKELQQQGKYEEAVGLAIRLCDVARQHFGADDPNYAGCLSILAQLYSVLGKYAAAEQLCQQALEIYRTTLGEDHLEFTKSLQNLIDLYHTQGKYATVEPLMRQQLEIKRRVVGEGDPDFAQSLNSLGLLYREMGNYKEAEILFQQALKIRRAVFGEDHPDFAQSLNNLALLYCSMDDTATAEALFQQASIIWRKALGENHPEYATSLNNLAGIYYQKGEYAAAESLFRQASEIWRNVFGENHPTYASSLTNLAGIYKATGNYTAAEPLFRQALEIRGKMLGVEHPDFEATLNSLVMLYLSVKNYQAAETLYQHVMEMRHKILGKDHPLYASSLNNLKLLREELGQRDRPDPVEQQMSNEPTLKPEAIEQSPLSNQHSETERVDQLLSNKEMPDERQQSLIQCCSSFIERDYASCLKQALALLSPEVPYIMFTVPHLHFQLLLISAQRVGAKDIVEKLAPTLLLMAEADPWHSALLKLTLGQTDLAQILTLAKNDEQRFQAHYYAGARLLTYDQLIAARSEFDAALAIRATCAEVLLLASDRKSTDRNAEARSGPTSQQQIDQINQQVVQLYWEGEYDKAIELGTQVRDLASQHLGERHLSFAKSLMNLYARHTKFRG